RSRNGITPHTRRRAAPPLHTPVTGPARATGRPPRAGHCAAAQRSPSRARQGRVAYGDGTSATLKVIFHGKEPAPIRRTGPNSTRLPHAPSTRLSVSDVRQPHP